jgi:hypothetical protein
MNTDHETDLPFAALRAAFPENAALTMLHIGAESTRVATAGTAERKMLELAIGTRITAATHFRHTPPTAAELEEAIQTVEDALFPVRAMLASASTLVTADPGIAEIADLAGIAQAPRRVLSREAVERLFGRMAMLAEGQPLAHSGLPARSDFYASLLILREFLHHQGFDAITVDAQR